ncbi:restriction endonuclease subunit S [Latilactobacillus curvatus]|nr:restriction endonuclease subunit S [Latilactobacillus curvatus]MCW8779776.1 restriction endonuclease subunit S [Latilactobacillus curvatus]
MNDNQAKYPQLRFKGFTDPWEERKLGELATFSKGKGYSKGDLVPDGHPIILYGRLYTKYETNIKSVDDTFVVDNADSVKSELGDVIVPGSGETAEDISRASNIEVAGIILGGDLNVVKPSKEMLDSSFLAITISNGSQQKELTRRAQGKSVVHLHNSDLQTVQVRYPSLKEQRKISQTFSSLDNLVAVTQRKLAKLKELKQGYLQKLFPRNGSKFPQLRFAGFADAWEDRKLGTIYDFGKGKGLPLESFIYSSNNPAIAYGHLYTKYSEVISEVFWSSNDNGVLSKDNDLLFPGSSTVPNGTAQANAITLNNVKLGGDIIIGRPKEGVGVLSTFMSYQINSQRQKLFPIIVGTTITHMYGKDISKLNFFITDYSEQEKIASFFKQLDATITLHQRKLEKLQELKKGYLQKIFC